MPAVRLARAAVLVLGVFGLEAQAAPQDPAGFVASIYANGHEVAVWPQWLDGAKRGAWFSRALTALWGQCDALAKKLDDKEGPLDFDVATNSQGAEVKKFTVKIVSQDVGHANVVAKLAPGDWKRNSERENEIRYDLVREGGEWKIDDIHSVVEPDPKPWSLRALLRHYLAE